MPRQKTKRTSAPGTTSKESNSSRNDSKEGGEQQPSTSRATSAGKFPTAGVMKNLDLIYGKGEDEDGVGPMLVDDDQGHIAAAHGKSRTNAGNVADGEEEEEDEWEEQILVAQLGGILHAETVRGAAQQGQVAVRYAETENPLVQVGSTIYTGRWVMTTGTDLIFALPALHSPDGTSTAQPTFRQQEGPSTTANTIEPVEESAASTSSYRHPPFSAESTEVRLFAVSDTRLEAQRAIPQLTDAMREQEEREAEEKQMKNAMEGVESSTEATPMQQGEAGVEGSGGNISGELDVVGE